MNNETRLLPPARLQYRTPAADIYETAEAYVVLLDLPGIRKESLVLTVEEGELRIKADRDVPEEDGRIVLLQEMPSGGYERAFTLGEGIDLSNVDATFSEGVLTVKLLKKEERKPREITIH